MNNNYTIKCCQFPNDEYDSNPIESQPFLLVIRLDQWYAINTNSVHSFYHDFSHVNKKEILHIS